MEGRLTYLKRTGLVLLGLVATSTFAVASGTIQCMGPEDSTGNSVAEKDQDHPYSVVTYKMHVHTQSRTVWHDYAMELFP